MRAPALLQRADTLDGDGHGSHTAGTVLGAVQGSGTAPGMLYSVDHATGMAPGARLSAFDIGIGASSSLGPPADLDAAFHQVRWQLAVECGSE